MANEFLSKAPFDLYELKLFQLVAQHRNFTKAGRMAGLTQSAITRQIQTLEHKLGLQLFERSTRSVRMTIEGARLLARSSIILEEVESALTALQGRSTRIPKTLRIGIARTIGLAYLPGFFKPFITRFPHVQLQITHERGDLLLASLEGDQLDAIVITHPIRLPPQLQVVRSFTDGFVLIAPPHIPRPTLRRADKSLLKTLLQQHPLLMITRQTQTGRLLTTWMKKAGIDQQPGLEADSFDLIINLVSLGLGVAVVPHRALALHPNTRPVTRIQLIPAFERELAVLIRRQPPHRTELNAFLEGILFGPRSGSRLK